MSKVIEATPTLQVVVDGIAVAANSQRVLKHYGILDNFYDRVTRNVGVMQIADIVLAKLCPHVI